MFLGDPEPRCQTCKRFLDSDGRPVHTPWKRIIRHRRNDLGDS